MFELIVLITARWMLFTKCWTGPVAPPERPACCVLTDFDHDGDTDLLDYAEWSALIGEAYPWCSP